MRFLADMGIGQRVVDWLRGQGHDAVHLREEGLQRLKDGDIFAKAVALARGKRTGVIVFRLHNTRAPRLIERLETVLPRSAAALSEGAIVVVEEARHRVRHLPIGGYGKG